MNLNDIIAMKAEAFELAHTRDSHVNHAKALGDRYDALVKQIELAVASFNAAQKPDADNAPQKPDADLDSADHAERE